MGEKLGRRRHKRVQIERSGFVIPAPHSPWFECQIIDVSENGVCLDVGDIYVPTMFGIAFNEGTAISRVCIQAWRQGGVIGAEFMSVKQLKASA